MAHLQSYPKARVQPHPLRGRDALIEHLLLQGMDEVRAPCHRAVWPDLFPAHLPALPSPGQRGTAVVHVLGL
jgi:hypothetical protein